uniref:homing endonuclease n=1 Tax=Leptographium wingfieldii TaxID=155675 RepID=UPI0023F1003F|nr:homing endonuclease [Leptographium wingfieldii]WDZ67388.1 homing endonuclease [Leptographium wingfieldii]WDZ67436.1 homing endonuclease [Leptographium wingfieldii]WDZ67483.1 homing endonuclease [Leptographium wingfieldii]WDZ67530.1 homing endonuclease [Leptographium wingfieldii]WDZ67576.1 homing endonuclease [Leptographium wingfieldii]
MGVNLSSFSFKINSSLFNSNVRCFHSSSLKYKTKNLVSKNLDTIQANTIKSLTEGRVAPILPFNSPVLITCSNILNQKDKLEFFSKLSDLIIAGKSNSLGVIYIFQYKFDPNLFYIGRTNNLKTRLINHISKYKFDKFHLSAKILGWENFSLSVIEIKEYSDLIQSENYYLELYKPLLNSIFRSFYSKDIYKKVSLIEELISKNLNDTNLNAEDLINNPYEIDGDDILLESVNYNSSEKGKLRFPIWVIEWLDNELLEDSVKNYPNRQIVSEITGVAVQTINRYLNTKLPKLGSDGKYYLFFSLENIVKDLTSIDVQENIILAKSLKLRFDSNLDRKVWAYSVDEAGLIHLLTDKPFKSLGETGAFFLTSSATILYYLDNFKIYKDYYLFSKPLIEEDKNILIERHMLSKSDIYKSMGIKTKIWVYDPNTLSLLNNTYFNSIQSAMDYLKTSRRSVLKYLDSGLILKSNNSLFYLFSQETNREKLEMLNNNPLSKSLVKSDVWVYSNSSGALVLLNENLPFSTINRAAVALGLSSHTIKKYLDKNISFKNYYFYSNKQDNI